MATAQSGTNNGYYAIMTVTQASQSVSGNYSTVNYSLTLYSGGINFSGYTIGYDVYVNGSQVAYHNNSGNQTSIGKNTSKLVVSGSTTVYHNADGTKSIPFSFRLFTDSTSYTPRRIKCF